MSKAIPFILLGCTIWSIAAPAYAGAVLRKPLTPDEDNALATQQGQDVEALAQVSGGDGGITLLAAVGLIFIVLLLAHAIE